MTKKAILCIFLVLLCLSFSGIVIPENVKSINNGNGFGTLSHAINNYILVATSDGNISIESDLGTTGYNLVGVDDATVINEAVVASDGHLYIATNDGIFKRLSTFTTPHLSSDFADDEKYQLMTTNTGDYLCAVDSYVYYYYNTAVYKLNVNTGFVSYVTDTSDTISGYTVTVRAMTVVSESEIYFLKSTQHGSNPAYSNLYFCDIDKNDYSLEDTFGNLNTQYLYDVGLQYVENGKIYYISHLRYWNAEHKYKNEAYILNETGVKGDIWSTTSYNVALNTGNNFFLGSNAYSAAIKDSVNVEIIATEDRPTDISSIPTALQYEDATINSLYTSYYNNSDLKINAYINIDLSDNDIDDYREISNLYQYEIDLIDSNGVQVENTIITTSFVPRGIIDRKAEITTTQTFSGTYINGTWNAKLFEVTKDTGARAELDSNSFEILNASSSSIIDTGTSIGGNTYDKILNNENFGALIVIIAFIGIFAGIGAKQDGDMTIMGAFLGFVVGSFVGFMAGLIPLWIVLSIVLVSIGIIASGIADKMG